MTHKPRPEIRDDMDSRKNKQGIRKEERLNVDKAKDHDVEK